MTPDRLFRPKWHLLRRLTRYISDHKTFSRVGECLRCSMGLGPSVFLGKVASDLQKPNGLLVITLDRLPDILLPMTRQDIYGIGPRMEARLNRAGGHDGFGTGKGLTQNLC